MMSLFTLSFFKRLALILMLCSLFVGEQVSAAKAKEKKAARKEALKAKKAKRAEKKAKQAATKPEKEEDKDEDDKEKEEEETVKEEEKKDVAQADEDEDEPAEADTWSKLDPGTKVKDIRLDYIAAGDDDELWGLDSTNKKVYQYTEDGWKEVVKKDALWISVGEDAVALLNTSGKLFIWNEKDEAFSPATDAPKKLDKVFVGDKKTMMGVVETAEGLEVWITEKGEKWKRAKRKADGKELLGFADISVMPDGSFVALGKDGSVYLPKDVEKDIEKGPKKKKKEAARGRATKEKRRTPHKAKAAKLKKKKMVRRVKYTPSRSEQARLSKAAMTSKAPARPSQTELFKAVEERAKAARAEQEAKKAERLAKKAAKAASKESAAPAAAPADVAAPAVETSAVAPAA